MISVDVVQCCVCCFLLGSLGLAFFLFCVLVVVLFLGLPFSGLCLSFLLQFALPGGCVVVLLSALLALVWL